MILSGLSCCWFFFFSYSFDPDPLKRHTFWTIVIGGSVMWTSIYAINQSQVQRYIACKTLTHAKMWVFLGSWVTLYEWVWGNVHALTGPLLSLRSLYVNMVGLWVTVSMAVFSGLTMYSIYKGCDPLKNGDISTPDQVITTAICLFPCCFLTKCDSKRYKGLYAWFKFICVNQLLPYLVMDILAIYPGVPGLFVAAAYSGTLRWAL